MGGARRLPEGVSPQAVAQLSSARRPSDIQRRLDAFADQMSGPYVVGGQTIRVSAAFRTLHGNADNRDEIAMVQEAIGPERSQELGIAVARATSSRGSPSDIRRVTQALIDAGALAKHLQAGASPDLAIRAVMKEHGIGLDCIGYTERAFLYSRGSGATSANARKYFQAAPGNVQFQNESAFRSVDVASARPGDIIHLPGTRQHNVIVHSNQTRALGSSPLVVDGKPVPPSFLAGATSVRVILVDSSWGDGGNEALGGSARESWLRNETTGKWGYWDHLGGFQTSDGPDGHSKYVVLRPRSES